MRDTWGPPRDGWPAFDAEGHKITESQGTVTTGELKTGAKRGTGDSSLTDDDDA